MTQKEIERIAIRAAKNNGMYVHRSNLLIKDVIKYAMRKLSAYITQYNLSAENFTLPIEEKNKIIKIITQKMHEIISEYIEYAYNTSKQSNKQMGITYIYWNRQDFVKKFHGLSLEERLEKQNTRVVNEIEAYLALAVHKSLSPEEITEIYMDNILSPHKNKDILAISYLGFATFKKTNLMKVEKGGIISAYKSIMRINEGYYFTGFSLSNNKTWGKANLTHKYIITAKDTNVCQICQDNESKIFKIDEFVVPAHNRCRCIEIPIL